MKKENELNKVTSLNDNEYIRAVTSDGGSVLIKKSELYPVATEIADGLMSSGDKLKLDKSELRQVIINKGEELSFPFSENGVYYVIHSNSGRTAILLTSSTVADFYIFGTVAIYSTVQGTANKFNIYRKEQNGTIYIQNNYGENQTLKISKL